MKVERVLGFASAVFFCFCLSVPAAWADYLTNELSKTVRIVKSQRVDLKPLADWYKDKLAGRPADETNRPLKAWELLSLGRITESGINWTVEAQVDGKKESIVLLNPPKKEYDEFNQLKSRHAYLLNTTNQIERELRRVIADRRRAVADVNSLRRTAAKWGTIGNAENRAAVLAQRENTLARDLEGAQAELRWIEAKGIDFKKPFSMECLALKTGEKLRSKPVYDRGQVFD